MQSLYSNNIGVIIGNAFKLISGEFVDAVGAVLTSQRKTLTLFTCPNGVADVAPALEKMIHQGMDAIIIHPNADENGADMQIIINSLRKRFSRLPPVIIIFSGVDFPGVFQVRIDEEETGRRAALRQLALGCRKFGVLSHAAPNPHCEMIIDSYCGTLIANGIAQDKIVLVNSEHLSLPEGLRPLEGIDGLWLSFLLTLPKMRPGLEKVCQLDKLHVDTFGSIEMLAMLQWWRPAVGKIETPVHPFKTLYMGVISLREAGICAAQMAIEAGADKNLMPFSRRIACDYVEFDETLKTLPLFLPE